MRFFAHGSLIIFLEDITLLYLGSLMNFIITFSSEVHKWWFPIWIGKEEPTAGNITDVWKIQDSIPLLTIPIFAHTQLSIEGLAPLALGEESKFLSLLRGPCLYYFHSFCLSSVWHHLLSGLLETIAYYASNSPSTLTSESHYQIQVSID